MCISLNASIKAPTGDTYLVQQIFSDATAAKGNLNPCIPDNGPFFGAGLWSGNSEESQITISTDQSGKGSAKFKIEPFAYDPSFGPIAFYAVGSWLPAGVTLTPDIARRRDSAGNVIGTKIWGNPGSTSEITISVDSTFQNNGQPVPILIIAHNYDKSRFNIWWGSLLVN